MQLLTRTSYPLRENRIAVPGARNAPKQYWHALAVTVALAVLAASYVAGQLRPAPRIPPVGSQAPIARVAVKRTYPHDNLAFTQGLTYHNGFLFEGTGLHGRSDLRRVELETGRVVQRTALPAEYFGEGITLWRSTIVQLTWDTKIGFVWDRERFRRIATFRYEGEGWGLTHDSTHLIMSDGTASLRFLDPTTFRPVRRLLVTDAGTPVTDLNELEWIDGEIYANVWRTDFIARISPSSGRVLGWVDLGGLLTLAEQRAGADVLNGIAYDSTGRRLFVTGKLWPKVFDVAIPPKR